jgi:hypothetical protein
MEDEKHDEISPQSQEDHLTNSQEKSQKEFVCEMCPIRYYSIGSSNCFNIFITFILFFIINIILKSLNHITNTLYNIKTSITFLHTKIDKLSLNCSEPKQKEERKEELNIKNISNIIEHLESLFRT